MDLFIFEAKFWGMCLSAEAPCNPEMTVLYTMFNTTYITVIRSLAGLGTKVLMFAYNSKKKTDKAYTYRF